MEEPSAAQIELTIDLAHEMGQEMVRGIVTASEKYATAAEALEVPLEPVLHIAVAKLIVFLKEQEMIELEPLEAAIRLYMDTNA